MAGHHVWLLAFLGMSCRHLQWVAWNFVWCWRAFLPTCSVVLRMDILEIQPRCTSSNVDIVLWQFFAEFHVTHRCLLHEFSARQSLAKSRAAWQHDIGEHLFADIHVWNRLVPPHHLVHPIPNREKTWSAPSSHSVMGHSLAFANSCGTSAEPLKRPRLGKASIVPSDGVIRTTELVARMLKKEMSFSRTIWSLTRNRSSATPAARRRAPVALCTSSQSSLLRPSIQASSASTPQSLLPAELQTSFVTKSRINGWDAEPRTSLSRWVCQARDKQTGLRSWVSDQCRFPPFGRECALPTAVANTDGILQDWSQDTQCLFIPGHGRSSNLEKATRSALRWAHSTVGQLSSSPTSWVDDSLSWCRVSLPV